VCTEERKGRGHGGDAGSQDRARGGVGIESARQLALAVAWNRRTAVAAATFAGGPSMEVDKQLMYGVAVAMADECLSWH
jgi:hypothetical protein